MVKNLSRRAWPMLYMYGIIGAYGALVLLVHHAPALQDFPDWIYQGVLFAHQLSGHTDAAYVFHAFPVPNSISTWALGILDLVFGWELAAKLWLVAIFVLTGYAIRAMSNEIRVPTDWIYWAAPTVALFNMTFWTGFINFQLGLAALLLWIVAVLRSDDQRPSRILLLSMYLAAIFFFHMIDCAAAMLVLCGYALQTRRMRLLLAMFPALALACWYEVALRLHPLSMSASESPARWGSSSFAAYKANSLLKAIGCVNLLETAKAASISLRLLGSTGFFLVLAMYVVFLAALVAVIAGGWRRQAQEQSFDRVHRIRFLWPCVAVLTICGLLLPAQMMNVINPGYRCLQLAIVLGIFLAVPALTKGSQLRYRVVAICAVLSCLLNLCQFAVIQIDPSISGEIRSTLLGRVALQATWTKPMYKWAYYESLKAHRMNMDIFNTGLYESADPGNMVQPPR